MKNYVLLFRMDLTTPEAQPSPEQMNLYMEQWMRWVNDMATRGQLADGGNHFTKEGKVLRSKNSVSEGPYATDLQSVAGYLIIKAKSMNDAMAIAQKCPILAGDGTSVEIREVGIPGV